MLSFGRPRLMCVRDGDCENVCFYDNDGDAINPRCIGVDGDAMGSVVVELVMAAAQFGLVGCRRCLDGR